MLRIKSLSLRKKKRILSDISLEFLAGEVTLLLGKSGAGKTSLLRCAAHLERDYEGIIDHKGESLIAMKPDKRCRRIGFVAQSYGLFPHMSVIKNCAQPLLNLKENSVTAEKKAAEVLSLFRMSSLASAYPHELSGGQCQRAAIARALVLQPDFLLLDEPTSALDPENTEILIHVIQSLRKEGKGVVISSQDMSFARKISDRIVFLENGRVVEFQENKDLILFPEKSRIRSFLSESSVLIKK